MATASNFVLLNDDEIADLIDTSDALNTKKQIQFSVGRFNSFAKSSGTTLEAVEAYSEGELDNFLSRFYGGLRKDDGNLYTKKSMHAIRYGIHRHFLSVKDWDITKNDTFKQSNKVYKAMMVKLKQEGKGFVQHKEPVSKDDMTKIFDSLDLTTPIGLQNKVFIDIMIYLKCERGSSFKINKYPSFFKTLYASLNSFSILSEW